MSFLECVRGRRFGPNAPSGPWPGVGCPWLGMVAQPWGEKVGETAPEKMSAWFSLASAASQQTIELQPI